MQLSPLERILELDALIRSPQRHTVASLAQALEVSQRTIHNDLDFLRDRFGAPLEWSRSQGHHYTDPSWHLPTIPLSKGELFALTLGAQMLESYAGSAYEAELRSSIDQLCQLLPGEMAVNLPQIACDRVRFRAGGQIHLDPTIWTQLLGATTRSQRIWIRYYSPRRRQESERCVDPYVLDVYRASNPYLWGYCHRRQQILSFRIDRIRELKVLAETFERDPTFNLQDYLDSSFQYEVGGQPMAVAIDFDAATAPFITERAWHKTQAIEERADGSITLRFTASGLNDIKRWILGYGKGAIAREPPELVAMLQQETEMMARQNECRAFD